MTMMLLQTAELGTSQMGEQSMTSAGWLFMGIAWLFVIGLTLICFKRVLSDG